MNPPSEILGLHADLLIVDDNFNDYGVNDEARKAFDFFKNDLTGGKKIKTIGPIRFKPDGGEHRWYPSVSDTRIWHKK